MPSSPSSERPGPPERRLTFGRLAALTGGRLAGQALGFAWFLVAARLLAPASFGRMSAGLAVFALVSTLGDLGTMRSVVRLASDDPTVARAAFARAVAVRGAGVGAIGAVFLILSATGAVDIPVPTVALAIGIALASGITDLGYGALRAVGRAGLESVGLLVERVAFVAVAWAAVVLVGGADSVLASYLATNAAAAVVVTVALGRVAGPTAGSRPRLLDAEGRRTAAGFVLLSLGPRVGLVLVALLGPATVVGRYAVAWRPVEAVSLLVMALLTPLLPAMRVAQGATEPEAAAEAVRLSHRAVVVATAVALPVGATLAARPDLALDGLAGPGYGAAAPALTVLAAVLVTWCLRAAVEQHLLAVGRIGTFARTTAVGLAVNLAVGVPLVRTSGATGAAVASLVAEGVMVVALAAAVPELWRGAWRSYRSLALLAVASAGVVAGARAVPVPDAVVVLALLAVLGLGAVTCLRALRASSAPVAAPVPPPVAVTPGAGSLIRG